MARINYIVDTTKQLVDLGPKSPRSDAHEQAKQILISCLKGLNFKPLDWPERDEAESNQEDNRQWLQPIYDQGGKGRCVGENIIGVLPGNGSSDHYILLIAHYDTLPGTPGADDNMASLTIVLESIARLGKWSGNNNIMVLFPDLEEPQSDDRGRSIGFLGPEMGSIYFYTHCPIPVDKIACAVVLDLVGHDLAISGMEKGMAVTGAENSPALTKVVLDAAKKTPELEILPIRNELLPGDLSDHHIFRVNRRPYLFLTCGWWEHYHRSTDTFERLNLERMTQKAAYLAELIRQLDASGSSILQVEPDDEFFLETEAEVISKVVRKRVPADKVALNKVGGQIITGLSQGLR